MNVSLTPELEKFIEESVASGRFASASEVVRYALRAEKEHEEWVSFARRKVVEGLEAAARGDVIDGEESIARLRHIVAKKKRRTA